jgi:hypothetical protein
MFDSYAASLRAVTPSARAGSATTARFRPVWEPIAVAEEQQTERWLISKVSKAGTTDFYDPYAMIEGPDTVEVEVVPAQVAERLAEAGAELLRLKDGPRDDAYRAAKPGAWDELRHALAAFRSGGSRSRG